jgi:hypothetical protein
MSMNLPSLGPQLLDINADIIEDLGHRADIPDVRHVLQPYWLLG